MFVIGDANLDGDVNSTDLGLLLNNFGDNTGLGWGSGNLNADSDVDSTDLGLLLNNFSFNSPPPIAAGSASVAIPLTDAGFAVDISFAEVEEDDEDAADYSPAGPFWW